MQFLQTIVADNVSVAAGTTVSYDLPVFPMSGILVTLRFLQNLANTQIAFGSIMGAITRIEVLYKGSTVFSASGADCHAVGRLVSRFQSWPMNVRGDDNDVLSFTWLVPFTRTLYSPSEAFPATTRGELVLQVTFPASFTQLDTTVLQVEAICLPEAMPDKWMKVTTRAFTPIATGDYRIDLPIGNALSDIVLFGTTIPAAATATKTINYVELLVNNMDRYWPKSYFETLCNMQGRMGGAPAEWAAHTHQLDAAAYAQYMDTLAVKAFNHALANYIVLCLDVFRDGTYILDTKGLVDLDLLINAGDTNAIRILPCEICAVGEGV